MTGVFDLPFDEPVDSAESSASEISEAHEGSPQPDRARTVYTVTELNAHIRDLLETAFVEVWVEGEISNFRVWNTGHQYFTLKDSSSQLKTVMFRSDARYLKFKPEDGLHVIARGRSEERRVGKECRL